MSYRLGIDVGGTFTDFLVLGRRRPARAQDELDARTTRREGFVRGLEEIAERLGAAAPRASWRRSTSSSTARPSRRTRRSPATAPAPARSLTEGFRDTLRLRDGTRATPYDNRLTPPRPLAPRERPTASPSASARRAQVLAELDEASVPRRRRRAARGRRGGRGDLLPALAAEPGARAARAGDRPRGAPRRVRDRVARPALADPLLPPHEHDGAQRLRRPDHQPLHDRADRAPRRAAVRRASCSSCSPTAGSRRPPRCRAAPRSRCCRVPPPGRPPGSSTCRAPASATASPSTWAGPASTSRWCATGRR